MSPCIQLEVRSFPSAVLYAFESRRLGDCILYDSNNPDFYAVVICRDMVTQKCTIRCTESSPFDIPILIRESTASLVQGCSASLKLQYTLLKFQEKQRVRGQAKIKVPNLAHVLETRSSIISRSLQIKYDLSIRSICIVTLSSFFSCHSFNSFMPVLFQAMQSCFAFPMTLG